MPDTELKLARAGELAVVTIDNGADHTRPTVLGRVALASLDRVLGELERGDFAAAVFTGKPYVFLAGADIDEFPRADAETARAGSRAGHELFARIAALPFPTLAAVNGACLGGGVELALHCTARTISTAVRHFAAPEVALGIIPAWGGTQLVPRLVDAKTAIRFVVQSPLRQNRMLDGRAAFEAGFADRLFEPVEFLDESLAFARELAAGLRPERPARHPEELRAAVERARAQLDDSIHGAAPAPYAALDLLAGSAEWTLEEGYRREEDAVAELLPGRQAQASLYAYDLVERRAKRRVGIPQVEPRRVRRVGIAGAGLMARQLAALFLRRLELPLVLRDVKQEILDEALEFVREELGDSDKARFLAGLVETTTGWDEFAGCDLVLEAVYEELAAKREVFAALEAVVSPECLLATNTSSLSLADMAADLEHPRRLVGLHFFNPVAVLPLVELVRAPETDDATLATAAAVAEKVRKRPVLVRDAPAFVVNRILTRMTTVLMDAIEHGTPVETTDAAILRLGLPMAPSVLLQMVGPRVANHVLGTLNDAFPERFPLSQTLANYAEGSDEVALREHAPRSQEEVLDEALEAIADEVRLILEEGVVAEAADVDTCLLLGAGFPFWLGGITRFLDQTGVSQRVAGRPLAEVRAEVPV